MDKKRKGKSTDAGDTAFALAFQKARQQQDGRHADEPEAVRARKEAPEKKVKKAKYVSGLEDTVQRINGHAGQTRQSVTTPPTPVHRAENSAKRKAQPKRRAVSLGGSALAQALSKALQDQPDSKMPNRGRQSAEAENRTGVSTSSSLTGNHTAEEASTTAVKEVGNVPGKKSTGHQILESAGRGRDPHPVIVKKGKSAGRTEKTSVAKKKGVTTKRKQTAVQSSPSIRKEARTEKKPKKKVTPVKFNMPFLLGAGEKSSKGQKKTNKTTQSKQSEIAPLHWSDKTTIGDGLAKTTENFAFVGYGKDWHHFPDDPDGAVEMVIGLDFGTTFTKVVISEGGSGRSWAIPLSRSLANPYLINSDVFLDEGVYTLSPADNCMARVKVPFLSKMPSVEHCHHAVAFLALVMRFAKQWFLNEKAGFLRDQAPFWFVNVGMPAKDYGQKKLLQQYETLIWAALYLSTDTHRPVDEAHVESAYENARIAVTGRLKSLEEVGAIPVHWDQVQVIPEIMAQLYGFLRSKHWDRSKPEFMLVDVGGGTIDSTVFNVVQDRKRENLTFAVFSARVEPLGTINLHQNRVKWIQSQVKDEKTPPKFIDDLLEVADSQSQFWMVPDSIEDYLQNALFDEPTYDTVFLSALKKVCLSEQLRYVLTTINPNFKNSGRNYPVILAGGGAANQLYTKLLDAESVACRVGIERLSLPQPESLEAPGLNQFDYHRISVAYGLSFENLGRVLTPSKIAELHIRAGQEIVKSEQQFVSKDMV